jgi:tRNA threonylcarbamoyl adenosine modification protein (Sua5/YciO/YrdC/YwlC family)
MLISIHPDNPNPRGIAQAVECLKDGGVIIYPTDTIYGIGCDIFHQKAVQRIAKIKNVDLKKQNFSFICSDLSQLSDYSLPINRTIYNAMRKVLPGPFTFILNANNSVPKLFKSKKKTVGIRIPNHSITHLLVKTIGHPILSSSVHDQDTLMEYSTDPELIYQRYKDKVDIVIDGGMGSLTPSTVIDCSNGQLDLIRQGLGNVDDLS